VKFNFVIPPSPYLTDDLTFPNLGVLYLSAVLKQHNYNVFVIDLHGHTDDWRHVLSHYINANTNLWGVPCVTPEFPLAIEILKEIKTVDPKAPVIIGGPMATCDYQVCLSAGFDKVVVGEGERAIVRIMEGCKDRILREPYILNLDEIPFPDRSAIDIYRYHYNIDGKKTTNVITTRGCFWSKCRFCCQTWDGKIRYRSSENVIEELKILSDMGFEGVAFSDDEFFSLRTRDLKICRGIEDLGMVFRCLTRSDLVTQEIAKVAARTGCRESLLGVESGSSKILQVVGKGITKEQNREAIKMLKENGIRVKALFMLGLPGESYDTIAETIRFIEETQPDICEFTIYTPYPNSTIWNDPSGFDISFNKERILTGGAWYKGIKGRYKSYVSSSSLTAEEIVDIRDELEEEYGGFKS